MHKSVSLLMSLALIFGEHWRPLCLYIQGVCQCVSVCVTVSSTCVSMGVGKWKAQYKQCRGSLGLCLLTEINAVIAHSLAIYFLFQSNQKVGKMDLSLSDVRGDLILPIKPLEWIYIKPREGKDKKGALVQRGHFPSLERHCSSSSSSYLTC